MIIENGTIEIQKTTGGGIDRTTGFPTVPVSSWGTGIPAQYSPVKYNALALSGGEPVTDRSYSILIEAQDFAAERVRLKDRKGEVVGEFSVISVEPLDAVDQIRITV